METTETKLQTLLAGLSACKEAVEWAGERDLATAWAECERADWLLWLAGNMADQPGWPSRKEVILAGIACGRLSLDHAGKYRERISAVFDVAERCANDPTAENIAAAWSAAKSAVETAVETADSAAWSAAKSAGSAAWSAAKSAVETAVETADSAAWSAAWSARSAARSAEAAAHKTMCEIIRKRLTIPKEL